MPDSQTLNSVLSAYGIAGHDGINWWVILGGILFSIIGWYAFMHGKKEKSMPPMAIGIALMVYPYFVPNPLLFFAIGIVLTAGLYFWRD